MKYATAKSLSLENIECMTLEQLQKHRVRLIDAWRESKASYGDDSTPTGKWQY